MSNQSTVSSDSLAQSEANFRSHLLDELRLLGQSLSTRALMALVDLAREMPPGR